MIELNLLPPELRKKKKLLGEMPRIPFIPIAIGVVAALVVINTFLMMILAGERGSLRGIEEKWEQMQPQRQKTGKIAKGITDFEKKVLAVRKIAKGRIDWAQLLNGLNQAVIPNIWLSDLGLEFTEESGDARRARARPEEVKRGYPVSLVLSGYALGTGEQATLHVAKFITSMERNKDFSDYFEKIELESMKNRKFDGDEVMMFNLGCRFKKPLEEAAQVPKGGK